MRREEERKKEEKGRVEEQRREREDKSMQGGGESRGAGERERERGRLRPLSHRQTAINKSIGNCGWLRLARTEDGKERDPNQSSSKMDGARRGMEKRWRREGGREVGGREGAR